VTLYPAKQVVLVLGTSAGKTLVVIISTSITDTGTIILILSTIALRGNMLRHFYKVGIRPLIWSIDYRLLALLVIMLAKAAYT
jgi:hypothetical protein